MVLQLGTKSIFEIGIFPKREERLGTIPQPNIITVAGLPDEDYPEGTLILNTADNTIYVMVTSTTAGIITPTAAWWKFNESSGNAADSSANSHTATNINTVDFLSGKYDNSADLNGTNEYFTVASDAHFNLDGDYTFEFWFYMGDKTETSVIMERFKDANEYFTMGIGTDWMGVTVESSGGKADAYFSLGGFSNNTWYHCAIVGDRGATALKIYINGELKSSGALSATDIVWTGENINIGASSTPDSYFTGRLDDFKVWSTARTQSQIVSDMSNPEGGQASGWVKVGLLPT